MVKIVTLGCFEVQVNGKAVSDSFRKSTKLLKLLNLLILNRDKPQSVDAICDAIWSDADADNAARALHNLIYRLRGIFAENGITDCISYNNRIYMLSTNQEWHIDIHKMEDCMQAALNPKLEEDERIALLQSVIDLYNGEYVLNLICEDMQSIYLSNRYKRIYTDAVCMLADIYLENNMHDINGKLCEKAIAYEPLEERILLRLIQSMRCQGKDMQAIGLIEDFFRLLYYETGMQASGTLNSIYGSLKGRVGSANSNVERVADELKGISTLDEALFCYFDTFRDTYRYEIRQNDRQEYDILLVLAEIHGNKNEEISDWTLSKAIKSFRDCCLSTLRKGDMFADYSKSQVIIMMKTRKETDVSVILARLRARFYDSVNSEKLRLKLETQYQYDI
jgi:DNA-binding SARP family transcriptional activator